MRTLTCCAILACVLSACPAPSDDAERCCDAGEEDAFAQEDSFAPRDASIADASEPMDMPDGGASLCGPEDFEAWIDAHRAIDLNARLSACALDPTCEGEPCSLEACLRDYAGVVDCQACAQQEIGCVAASCRSECSGSSTSDRCRFCICEASCLGRFEACAGMEAALCERCDPSTERCQPFVLPPALIMVITG